MSRQCIRLKAVYLPLVERGIKRSTIRAGAKMYAIGPADLVAGNRSVPICITEVEVKRFAKLTDIDAQTDGFDSLKELNEALLRFYPELGADDLVSILHFERTA